VIRLGTDDTQYSDLDHFLRDLGRVVKSPDIDDLYDLLAMKQEN